MADDLKALRAKLEQLERENEQLKQAPKRTPQRTIKLNQSGGVFVRDPAFRAWSASKEKYYTAGLNIPADVAAALFMPMHDGAPNPILRDVMTFVEQEFGAGAKTSAA